MVIYSQLSPRELAVLKHLSGGLRVPAVATRMGLSAHTVRVYLRRAQRKLAAATPTQATVIAVRRKLI